MALCVASLGCLSCGYSDFRLPALPPADPQIGYQWEPRPNPVLPHGAAGDPDSHDALNPSVVRLPHEYYNFYSGYDGKTWRTLLASSADGLSWVKQGAVLSADPAAGEGSSIAANGAAIYDSGFDYWYQAGAPDNPQIGFARSKDGRAWSKSAFPVIGYGPRGSWDERALGDPYVLKAGQYYYLFYLGQDRARRQRLGVARSRDGEHWTKLRSNPILDLGAYGAFDEMGLGEPAVWIAHGYYWMLYTGRDAGEHRRLGMARSRDGVHWDKLPTVFAGAEPWDSQVVCDATIELQEGRLTAWFGGGDAARPDQNINGQIGMATLHAVTVTARMAK